jgi:acyl carrier protein
MTTTVAPKDIVALMLELSPVPRVTEQDIVDCPELLTGGLIDSLALLQIVELIERTLGKPLPVHEISIENFNSVAAILRLVARTTT